MTKLVIALLIAAGLTLGTAPAAVADTPGCVTKGEYKKVRKGMTVAKVHRIFDTKGKVTASGSSAGSRWQFREYDPCVGDGWVDVDYDKEHGDRGLTVTSKSMVLF